MKTSGTAHEWLAKGIEHVFFFQDTNPLVLHTVLPALVCVSVAKLRHELRLRP